MLTTRSATKAVLASQIELCDILLEQIRSISGGLEKRIGSRNVMSRRSEAARRTRSNRHPTVPPRDRPNRSKRGKSAPPPGGHRTEAAKREKEDVT